MRERGETVEFVLRDWEPLAEVMGESLEVELEDGTRLTATHAYQSLHTTTWETGSSETNIVVYAWGAEKPGSAVVAYVAELEGRPEVVLGNLSIETRRHRGEGGWSGSNSWGHVYFPDTAVDYFLTSSGKKSDSWSIAIVPKTPPITRDAIFEALTLIQFVLGVRLSCSALYGLDMHATTVAKLGPSFGSSATPRRAYGYPVPTGEHQRAWYVAFFKKLLLAHRREPSLQLLGFARYYLDSLDDHADGAYLRLSLALRGLSSRLLESRDTRLVADGLRWEQLASAFGATVAELWQPKHGPTIQAFLAGLAGEPPMISVIEEAMRLCDLPIVPKVRDELNYHERALRWAIMSDESDQKRDLIVHIATMRTILVAMMARISGYAGEICGWTRVEGHYDSPPRDFWPSAQDGDDARVAMHAHHLTAELPIALQVEWPSFSLPRPAGPIWDQFSHFCASLSDQTNGVVTAYLHPVLNDDGEVMAYDLRIRPENSLFGISTILTVSAGEANVVVRGWSEHEIPIATPSDAGQLLYEVAKSPRLRRRVLDVLAMVGSSAAVDGK